MYYTIYEKFHILLILICIFIYILKAKDDTIEYNAPEPKKQIISKFTYGVELCEVEKDEIYLNVPKFVVECIKFIEEDENIRTNGIYRASGKKDSIEKVKKKVCTCTYTHIYTYIRYVIHTITILCTYYTLININLL